MSSRNIPWNHPLHLHPSITSVFQLIPPCISILALLSLFLTPVAYSRCNTFARANRGQTGRERDKKVKGTKGVRIEVAQVGDGGESRSALCKKRHPKCRPTGFAHACTCHVYPLKRGARQREGGEGKERRSTHVCWSYTHVRRSNGAVACALTPARMHARA